MGRYLVTGVAGFIGAKVADLLLREGHLVVGIDNLNDAYDVRLKQWRLDQLLGQGGFRFSQIDISQRASLETHWPSMGSFDGVINLAARAGVRYSVDNPWIYFETNTTGTLNLLELCRRHHIAKFILASSSSVYGVQNVTPYSESADTSRPLSPYAASKQAAETLCYTYHHLYDLDITVLRYFTVYGPAGRPDMSPFRFVQWISEGRPVTIYGDGRQLRDFTYIDDIARGTILGLKPLGYQVINLGTEHPIEILEAIQLIERLTGKPALLEFKPAHHADVRLTWANTTRAREQLGWQPEVSCEEGFARLVDWYREQRSWACEISTA